MPNLEGIKTAIAELNEDDASRLVREALDEGIPALEILRTCQDGMSEVGRRFECQDYFVSDLMMSGEIFNQVSAILEPSLKADGGDSGGKVVMGTVKGDVHDIGKNIVVNMLRAANFEVIDLGVDVAPEAFVSALQSSGAKVMGLSGLLTLAFDSMKSTVAALKDAGLRDQVKIMVGGGPVDANVCRFVGADAWGADAQSAIRLAKSWLEAERLQQV